MYRFLRKRYEADEIGREVAAVVLASYREYRQESGTSESEFADSASSEQQAGSSLTWEQETMLANEEAEWHKSVRNKPETEEKQESVWADRMVLDSRIAGRMRKFILTPEEEERAGKFTGDETPT
jgi:import inner membrane translocase subunit TIM54